MTITNAGQAAIVEGDFRAPIVFDVKPQDFTMGSPETDPPDCKADLVDGKLSIGPLFLNIGERVTARIYSSEFSSLNLFSSRIENLQSFRREGESADRWLRVGGSLFIGGYVVFIVGAMVFGVSPKGAVIAPIPNFLSDLSGFLIVVGLIMIGANPRIWERLFKLYDGRR